MHLADPARCAMFHRGSRAHSGSLTRAAFLSARNDALANVAIIAAGFVIALTLSGWPDLVVGLGIAALNADAARQVWRAAHEEHRAANAWTGSHEPGTRRQISVRTAPVQARRWCIARLGMTLKWVSRRLRRTSNDLALPYILLRWTR